MSVKNIAKIHLIYRKVISAYTEGRILPQRPSNRRQVALHNSAVASSLPNPETRPGRLQSFLSVAAICLLCLVFAGGSASAQDSVSTGLGQSAAEALATRVEANDQTGTIRIIIDGDERAVFDANGLHVNGDITYTGTLTDISDIRLKTDIHRLPSQSDTIAALNPVAFSMTGDPAQRTEFGVIAQDMESVYPALVETRPGGAKAVNYTGLIAPLVSAVQELQADNARLRARIEALETGTDQAPAQAEAR